MLAVSVHFLKLFALLVHPFHFLVAKAPAQKPNRLRQRPSRHILAAELVKLNKL